MAQPAILSVEWPAGTGGLDHNQNLLLVPASNLTWVESISVEQNTWQKEAGAVAFNTPPLGVPINCNWDFWNGNFVQEQVCWLNDGRLVVVDATGITKTLFQGTPGLAGWFNEGWLQAQYKALFFNNGVDPTQVYCNTAFPVNGVSTDYQTRSQPLLLPSPDWSGTNWPSMAFQHKFRMVYLGYTPHRAYLSSPTGHDQVGPTAGAIPDTTPNIVQLGDSVTVNIYPGEGQFLAAGISFREKCYLFKHPRGLYLLDDTDPNVYNWNVYKLTDSIGVSGPGCLCATNDDVYFIGDQGYFYALSSVYSLNQQSVNQLLPRQLGDFIRSQINLEALDRTRAFFYARKNRIQFFLPGTGSPVPNRCLEFDLNMMPQTLRVTWSSRDVAPAATLRRQNMTIEPFIGDDQGTLWRLDQSARNKGGAGYTSQFEHADTFILEGGVKRAILKEIQLSMRPEGNWNLNLEVHRDGRSVQTLAFSMQTPGAPVGSVSLDADVLAGQTIANDRHRLTGDAHTVKIIGYNNNANENFSVARTIIRYKPGRVA